MIKKLPALFFLLLFLACSNDSESIEEEMPVINLASLRTVNATSITDNSATAGGNITNDGGGQITERGLVWSTSPSPTTADNKLSSGTGSGEFSLTISNLERSTQYFLRAYAVNSAGTAYGNEISFTTNASMVGITTKAIVDITSNSANSGGLITDDGGSEIITKGVCWSISPNPTIEDNKSEDGPGTDEYISGIVDLEPNTEYFVRSYAENSVGISYGNEISFTTNASLVVISTREIVDITANSANSGGLITDDGGSEIIAKGVCWGPSPNPTIEDNITQDGEGIEEYVSSIVDLEPNTEYFVRSYAENSAGISYGNEISFTTLEAPVKVFDANATLTSQFQVDSFGAGNYQIITGNLVIRGSSILDLNPLSTIQKVGGHLLIQCENLVTLKGLENLEEIGSLSLNNNDLLESIQDLESLEIIVENIFLQGNDSLESLAGLGNIMELNGYFYLFGNQSLLSLEGLNKLERIGDYLRIENNRSLENISALSNLKEIGGSAAISSTLLLDLSGFDNLETIGDFLEISSNENLLSIGLPKLTSVNRIIILNNDNMLTLDGFSSIFQINTDLNISSNDRLESISGFENLQSVGGSFDLGGLELMDLNGFLALNSIGGNFLVGGVEKIINLNSFMNVTEIGMDVIINGNDSLETLDGINSSIEIGGDIYLTLNKKLSNYCALQPIFINGFAGNFNSSGNFPFEEPSFQDIVDGNCSF